MLCWIYAELDWFKHFAYSNLKSDLFLHNFSYSQKCVFSLLNSLILPCEVFNEFWLKWCLLPPIRTRWRVSRGLKTIQPVTCQYIKTHTAEILRSEFAFVSANCCTGRCHINHWIIVPFNQRVVPWEIHWLQWTIKSGKAARQWGRFEPHFIVSYFILYSTIDHVNMVLLSSRLQI